MNQNPFVTSGYVSSEYFCDREQESAEVIMDVEGRNNKVLISPRRMGKTGLILHCFNQPELRDNYYCFFIDIYPTLNLSDFVVLLGNKICEVLKPKGKNAIEAFCRIVRSLEFRISFDSLGQLEASFGLGDIKDPQRTLDEIFSYINSSEKRCVVAIDEFQQISKYPETHTEALLRTHVQHCTNASFIFAGSQRHMLQNMFFSASKPFYHSASVMSLKPIPLEKYSEFVIRHFNEAGKQIAAKDIEYVYELFEGHTWYMQSVFYLAYYMTIDVCTCEIIQKAIQKKLDDNGEIYEAIYYGIPEKQRELLKALACEGKFDKIQSGVFIKKYNLPSASSVQSAAKRLLDNDLITIENNGLYSISDRFLSMWLRQRLGRG
ncbi:AAA family ATPase [Bacteroides faecium]|uniref:ATP-binding protein n=1 Tax=Bacteroides faecium TaxID=2715212 RepID=A0A6H0KMA3_9BACE|nr:ATP-binding protein [Bacteroides faecium]QIU94584.1 ATP-binding protein [Bacteroides faecium]